MGLGSGREEPAREIKTGGETTVRDFITVLLRRKWVILALVLAATAYVGWQAARAKVTYRSAGQILIRPGERSSTMVAHLEFRPWEEVMNSEITILTSEPIAVRAGEVLRKKYEAEGVPGRIPRVHPKHIKTDAKRNSNIIDVTYEAMNPKTAREVLDAVMEAYVTLHRELFELPDAHELFDEEIMKAQRDLEMLERERKTYAERMDITALDRQKDEILTRLRILRTRRSELRQRVAKKRAEIDETRRLLEDGDGTLPLVGGEVTTAVENVFSQTWAELTRLEGRRRELLAKYRPSHPEVRVLEEQIGELQEDLVGIARRELDLRGADLRVFETQMAAVDEEIRDLESELGTFPEKEMAMNQYERSLGLVTNTFREVLAKEMHMKISEVSGRDYEVVVLSAAGRPAAINPRDPVRLSLAPTLSLFISIGLAFFLDRMDRSLKTREDVEDYVGLPVLSSVPDVRFRRRP